MIYILVPVFWSMRISIRTLHCKKRIIAPSIIESITILSCCRPDSSPVAIEDLSGSHHPHTNNQYYYFIPPDSHSHLHRPKVYFNLFSPLTPPSSSPRTLFDTNFQFYFSLSLSVPAPIWLRSTLIRLPHPSRPTRSYKYTYIIRIP
jgi:hypothetical protein